jgi:hypothetical protein
VLGGELRQWECGYGAEVGGGREESKALGMRLWNIGRNAERSAGKGECGYMSKEGHRQGTKSLGTVRAINDVGK